MRKSILFAVMLTLLGGAYAQKSGSTNVFDIHHNWDKSIGYSYQAGYPYGFSLAGGTFMTVGFGNGETKYRTTTIAGALTEYDEPTWSMRFGWIGYSIDEKVTGWGAVTFRPFVNLGMDFVKHYTINSSLGYDTDTKTYFTFAPSLGVNIYMFNFFVGYEIVPKFKELNGFNFGIGFSFPNKDSESLKDKLKK